MSFIIKILSCAVFAILSLCNATNVLHQNKFTKNNEHWQIIGNKIFEPAVHQSYNINNDISHYIMFKDNLINSDYKNNKDYSVWYFQSPEIIINNVPRPGTTASKNFHPTFPNIITFAITSFAGDFTELNENNDLIKLRQENSCITFKAPNYDGKTKTFIVPFVSNLWRHEISNLPVTDKEMKNMFLAPFNIEILGDWTKGYEVVGLDNVIIYI